MPKPNIPFMFHALHRQTAAAGRPLAAWATMTFAGVT